MTICSRAVLPVFAIFAAALFLLAGPIARAQDAIPGGKAVVTENVRVTESGNTTEVTIEERSAPAESGHFQGLIPPSGSAPKVSYGAPRQDGDDTHPPIRLTPDKSEIVRLEEDAVSVIVGNPDHLGVLMDDARLLILVPRQPGATYLTLLNKDGQVIMQRHVIVSVANRDYIRIRRSCGAAGGKGGEGCQETSVYYCKGMCHETALVENGGNAAVAPPVPSRAAASAGADVTLENGGQPPVTPEAEAEPEPEPEPEAEPEPAPVE